MPIDPLGLESSNTAPHDPLGIERAPSVQPRRDPLGIEQPQASIGNPADRAAAQAGTFKFTPEPNVAEYARDAQANTIQHRIGQQLHAAGANIVADTAALPATIPQNVVNKGGAPASVPQYADLPFPQRMMAKWLGADEDTPENKAMAADIAAHNAATPAQADPAATLRQDIKSTIGPGEIAPPKNVAEKYLVDLPIGLAQTVAEIGLQRKLLPQSLQGSGPVQEAAAWEIQNQASGGKPGHGAAMGGTVGSLGKILPDAPVKQVLAEGALFGGTTYAATGNPYESAVNALLPAAMKAPHMLGGKEASPVEASREIKPPDAQPVAEPSGPANRSVKPSRDPLGIESPPIAQNNSITPKGAIDSLDPDALESWGKENLMTQVAESPMIPALPEMGRPKQQHDPLELLGALPSKAASPAPVEAAPPQPKVIDPADINRKPIHEMSPDELTKQIELERTLDDRMLTRLFGADATRYKKLDRATNSMDTNRADAASSELQDMQDRLTPEQQDELFGRNQPERPDIAEMRDTRDAILNVQSTSTAEELGKELRFAITNVGDEIDPAKMKTARERVAYAEIRAAMEHAAANGFDEAKVMQTAIAGASARFSDPEDAAFMLRRFLKPRDESAQPAQEAKPPKELAPPPPSEVPPPQKAGEAPPAPDAVKEKAGEKPKTDDQIVAESVQRAAAPEKSGDISISEYHGRDEGKAGVIRRFLERQQEKGKPVVVSGDDVYTLGTKYSLKPDSNGHWTILKQHDLSETGFDNGMRWAWDEKESSYNKAAKDRVTKQMTERKLVTEKQEATARAESERRDAQSKIAGEHRQKIIEQVNQTKWKKSSVTIKAEDGKTDIPLNGEILDGMLVHKQESASKTAVKWIVTHLKSGGIAGRYDNRQLARAAAVQFANEGLGKMEKSEISKSSKMDRMAEISRDPFSAPKEKPVAAEPEGLKPNGRQSAADIAKLRAKADAEWEQTKANNPTAAKLGEVVDRAMDAFDGVGGELADEPAKPKSLDEKISAERSRRERENAQHASGGEGTDVKPRTPDKVSDLVDLMERESWLKKNQSLGSKYKDELATTKRRIVRLRNEIGRSEVAAEPSKLESWGRKKLDELGPTGLRGGIPFDPIKDPQRLAAYAAIGMAKLARGAKSFAEWSKQMLADHADLTAEHLRTIWDHAHTLASLPKEKAIEWLGSKGKGKIDLVKGPVESSPEKIGEWDVKRTVPTDDGTAYTLKRGNIPADISVSGDGKTMYVATFGETTGEQRGTVGAKAVRDTIRSLVDAFPDVQEIRYHREGREVALDRESIAPAPRPADDGEPTTSARKAQMAEDRSNLDLPELPEPERKSWQTNLDNARSQKIPERAMRIAAEINEKPRALSDDETAGMAIHASDLKTEHEFLMKQIGESKDPIDIQSKSAEVTRIEQDFDALSQALKSSGTEKGRALASQKLTINQNYDLLSVKNRAKSAKGEQLSERETAKLTDLVNKLNTRVAEFERQLSEQKKTKAAKGEYGSANRIVKREAYEAAKREWLSTSTTGTVTGATAAKLAAAAKIAAYHVEAGTRSFAAFTRKMVEDLGEEITPHVKSLYEGALKQTGAADEMASAREQKLTERVGELQSKIERHDLSKPDRGTPPTNKKIQELEYHRDRLRQQITREIESLKPKSIFTHGVENLNAARTLMASGEFSFVLRQGGAAAYSHPIRAAKATADAFRAFASDQFTHRAETEIANHPAAPLAKRAGLAIIQPKTTMAGGEKAYAAKWLEKIPVVGPTLDRFSRAGEVFLNKVRMDSFDSLTKSLARNGEPTLAESKAIATYVNESTGHGRLPGGLEQAAGALNTMFFSPRYVMSRFQYLTLHSAWGGTGRTRMLIAKEYAKTAAGLGVVYGLALAAGATVETDRRSADFGKLRFGKTRLDPLMGLAQILTLEKRVETNQTKDEHGAVKKADPASTIGRFAWSKLAPGPGTALNLKRGEDFVGNKADAGTEAWKLAHPMMYDDAYKAIRDQGVDKGTAMGLMSFFGWGLETHSQRQKNRR